jgi:genome maintenance exonuclease 1
MAKEFKFVDLNKDLLPNTKGRRQNGVRFYEVNGHNYPSVTSILGIRKTEGLAKWRESIGNDVANFEMRRAANRGKATHNLVENYLKGEAPSERSVLPLGLFRLMKPYLDNIDNVHLIEDIMYSKKLTLAGQVDCVAEYRGKLSVIDFKTANKEKIEDWVDNYFLLTTAYAIMYEELFGKRIEQLVILIAGEVGSMRLPNNSSYIIA